MKKLLLSVAVIAASGAYVAYQDHGAAPLPGLAARAADTPSAAFIAPAALKPEAAATTVDPTATPAPLAPAPLAPASAAAPPPSPSMTTAMAESLDEEPSGAVDAIAAPLAPPAAPAPAQSTSLSARATAEVVPLPLPRPADAPQAGAAPAPDGWSAQEVAATRPVAPAQGAYRNGVYKGVSANAYYGRVQVEAIVSNGRLASIRMLDYPRDRRRSLYIAQQSLPVLEQEAITAQNAHIDTVSGATLTSRAFIRSLDSALSRAQAGGGNA